MRRRYWTVRETVGEPATLTSHATLAKAEKHYGEMRLGGGITHIGVCYYPMNEAEARTFYGPSGIMVMGSAFGSATIVAGCPRLETT